MNRDDIKKLLPHREPMLLVDELTLDGDTALGSYTVTGDEWFVQGHFPGNPVVPGVVLCEMIGQSCAVIIGDQLLGKTPFFTGMNKVKFRRTARPGDKLTLKARIVRHNGPFYITEGEALIDGQTAAQGEFSFALIRNDEATEK
ncbi:MAG TPA: 3-hydroxyacyl-ACP dehydratase FabZ [Candidatus Limiplasma sp.]|nr:3-hydroxyacyl-ACP dehydratase FabZ [Candidatus Limiplasma sp.]HPS80951.1 3-hydroxyacyl-ACP dehydratase FabZ [Candidatus Limiplasma sp.]